MGEGKKIPVAPPLLLPVKTVVVRSTESSFVSESLVDVSRGAGPRKFRQCSLAPS